MAKPELSIIMPSYNVASLIPRAIRSVLAQSFRDWELIVVDDGSSDNLHEAVEPFVSKDERIRLVTKPNGGLSDARNFGLSFANGTYIHFFDPDDYINSSGWYDSIFEDIKSADIAPDVIITGYYVGDETVDQETHIIHRPLLIPFGGRFGEKCISHVCYAWNKFFRREFLLANNLQYEKGLSHIEDAEFMSRVVKYRPAIKFIHDGEYVYVQRAEQTLSKGFDPKLVDISKRRIGIDVRLVEFFNTDVKHDALVDCLKTSATISITNRLYYYGRHFSSEKRHEVLDNIRTMLPARFTSSRRGLMNLIFDSSIYWSIKARQYRLKDLVQKIRLTVHK